MVFLLVVFLFIFATTLVNEAEYIYLRMVYCICVAATVHVRLVGLHAVSSFADMPVFSSCVIFPTFTVIRNGPDLDNFKMTHQAKYLPQIEDVTWMHRETIHCVTRALKRL